MTSVNYKREQVEVDFINNATYETVLTLPKLSREEAIVTMNQMQI